MIGIYKITSPSKRIYIGQSRDIESRLNDYKNLNNCNKQTLLWRSFLKYGVINHTFEIIEECLFKELNIRERYWQEYFEVVEKGLNCFYTKTDEKPREISEEYKKQISNTLKEKYKSGELVCWNSGNGRKFDIYDYLGNKIYSNIPIKDVLKNLNLINESTIEHMIRKGRFLVKKQYIVILKIENYKDYLFNYIKKYNGESLPVYQIFDNGNIEKCTISSKYRVIKKLLNSENYIYYSKKNKSYYTFIGLINAVLDRNILDN